MAEWEMIEQVVALVLICFSSVHCDASRDTVLAVVPMDACFPREGDLHGYKIEQQCVLLKELPKWLRPDLA